MDAKNTAKEILKNVGGKENVNANVACMTRLRLGIKDNDKVNVDALKRIDGVLAVVQADTLQVVLGPGKVNKVAEPFAELTGVALGSDSDDGDVSSDSQLDQVKDIAKENKKENKAKHDKPLQRGLQHIANVFIPLLPGIIAAGLINGLANVIDYQTGQAFVTDWWYMTIKTIGWGDRKSVV